jgi:hypothetical protein
MRGNSSFKVMALAATSLLQDWKNLLSKGSGGVRISFGIQLWIMRGIRVRRSVIQQIARSGCRQEGQGQSHGGCW